MTSTNTNVKLTKITAAAMDTIETSYESGREIDAEECVGVVFTKTTVTGPAGFFQRVAEDLERQAEGWRCGDYSIAYDTNRDLSDAFVEAADARIAEALDAWAARCHELGGTCRFFLGSAATPSECDCSECQAEA